MRRRGVGVGAVKDLKAGQEKYKEKGSHLQENLVEEVVVSWFLIKIQKNHLFKIIYFILFLSLPLVIQEFGTV